MVCLVPLAADVMERKGILAQYKSHFPVPGFRHEIGCCIGYATGRFLAYARVLGRYDGQ